MKTTMITLLITFTSAIALAAGGHHGEGIPTDMVIYQAINLTILFSAIIYFTKDAAISFFKSREENFLSASKKAAEARASAEAKLADIKSKISELETGRSQMIQKAKNQAEELQANTSKDAANLVAKIKADTDLSIRLEVQKAKDGIRSKLLSQSLDKAKHAISKEIKSTDQQKLQKDFINQVGV